MKIHFLMRLSWYCRRKPKENNVKKQVTKMHGSSAPCQWGADMYPLPLYDVTACENFHDKLLNIGSFWFFFMPIPWIFGRLLPEFFTVSKHLGPMSKSCGKSKRSTYRKYRIPRVQEANEDDKGEEFDCREPQLRWKKLHQISTCKKTSDNNDDNNGRDDE